MIEVPADMGKIMDMSHLFFALGRMPCQDCTTLRHATHFRYSARSRTTRAREARSFPPTQKCLRTPYRRTSLHPPDSVKSGVACTHRFGQWLYMDPHLLSSCAVQIAGVEHPWRILSLYTSPSAMLFARTFHILFNVVTMYDHHCRTDTSHELLVGASGLQAQPCCKPSPSVSQEEYPQGSAPLRAWQVVDTQS